MSKKAIDVSQLTHNQEHQNHLLSLQNRILEQIALQLEKPQWLMDELCRCAESILPDALASITRINQNQEDLDVVSAPSAPQAVIDDLAGLKPGPENGSCGHAVYSGQATYVCNTLDDSRWNNLKPVAETYKIAACWSQPIQLENKTVGSFALSSFETREPTEFQKDLLRVCANLASLIFQRESEHEKLWSLAHHDSLTGLPNRKLFEQQVNHAITNANRNGSLLAVLFFDLDNFKDINDTFGHDFGDKVLLTSMERIKSCLREGDTISRQGGDEFILLLENLNDKLDIDNIAKKILGTLQHPQEIDGQKISVHFSIGISLYPDDADNYLDLLKSSDLAMYQAKKEGKNGIHYFEKKLSSQISEKVSLEQELREALFHDEFELHYQPQYLGDSGHIESLEALIRWNHPFRGLLLPGDFIPLAEKSLLINEISRYVMQAVCKQGRTWIDQGFDIPRLAVNFSTSQLTESCAERITGLISKEDFDFYKLEIEVTETLVMNRGKIAIEELIKMRSLGVSLAMDDFGTGYSSLSQLKMLPIHKVKIDRSFVKNIMTNDEDKTIIRAIISMAKTLGMQTVAEGWKLQSNSSSCWRMAVTLFRAFTGAILCPVPR